MRYAPHTIRYRRASVTTRDQYNRPVKESSTPWKDGGICRCDDNSTQDLSDDNGRVYRSTYKIVIDGKTSIQAGDEVEVYAGGVLRGSGRVNNVVRCNYLPFSVIWV